MYKTHKLAENLVQESTWLSATKFDKICCNEKFAKVIVVTFCVVCQRIVPLQVKVFLHFLFHLQEEKGCKKSLGSDSAPNTRRGCFSLKEEQVEKKAGKREPLLLSVVRAWREKDEVLNKLFVDSLVCPRTTTHQDDRQRKSSSSSWIKALWMQPEDSQYLVMAASHHHQAYNNLTSSYAAVGADFAASGQAPPRPGTLGGYPFASMNNSPLHPNSYPHHPHHPYLTSYPPNVTSCPPCPSPPRDGKFYENIIWVTHSFSSRKTLVKDLWDSWLHDRSLDEEVKEIMRSRVYLRYFLHFLSWVAPVLSVAWFPSQSSSLQNFVVFLFLGLNDITYSTVEFCVFASSKWIHIPSFTTQIL